MEEEKISDNLTCSGCGVAMQHDKPDRLGYLAKHKVL